MTSSDLPDTAKWPTLKPAQVPAGSRLRVGPRLRSQEPVTSASCGPITRTRSSSAVWSGRSRRSRRTCRTGTARPSSTRSHTAWSSRMDLGGSQSGEEASRLAVVTFVNLVLHTPDWIMRVTDETRRADGPISDRYSGRRGALRARRRAHGAGGMATTMTLACSSGHELFVGHVGDTRAYVIRGDELIRLTRDHSFAGTGRLGDDRPAGGRTAPPPPRPQPRSARTAAMSRPT